MQAAIRESAKSLGLATTDLPSLAGHDAQEIARIAPMAMIFVPSKDGISHSPKEFTAWQDVANGSEVLYRSILLLDRQLNPKRLQRLFSKRGAKYGAVKRRRTN